MRKRQAGALRERRRQSQQASIVNAAAMADQAVDLVDDYERTGRLDLLNAAIELLRDAVAATPPGHPHRLLYLSTLGSALQIRFERIGQAADLEEAITAGRDAVAATPVGHSNRPACLSNLGARCRPGSSAPASWPTWTRPSPPDAMPSPPPHQTTPCTCPTSGARCAPGSGAPASRPTWTRPLLRSWMR